MSIVLTTCFFSNVRHSTCMYMSYSITTVFLSYTLYVVTYLVEFWLAVTDRVIAVSLATLQMTLYPQLEKDMSKTAYGILDTTTFYVSLTIISVMSAEVFMHVLAAGLMFFTHVGYALH